MYARLISAGVNSALTGGFIDWHCCMTFFAKFQNAYCKINSKTGYETERSVPALTPGHFLKHKMGGCSTILKFFGVGARRKENFIGVMRVSTFRIDFIYIIRVFTP